VRKRKSVLVPLAFGFEEVEAVTVIDVLRRAGLRVLVAGVGETTVTGSRRLKLAADVDLEDTAGQVFDAVALPGGMPGTENLAHSDSLRRHIRATIERGGWIGAICAAPTILEDMGVLGEHKATCHPTVRARLHKAAYDESDVVISPPFVTSRGPGTAMAFALALVQVLIGSPAVEALAEAMVVPRR
jgi:4-methyl-5(b-hydroxyethyl)-thiazole monophosphate biosynthesis